MSVPADLELTFGGDSFLDPAGQRSGLIMLGSLLLSFLLIRTSTRLMRSPKVPWWPGSIKTGGVHVHHLVPGIVLMLLCGFLLALEPGSPWVELVAAGFGVGAGLTLDEYALWLHLEDVYWAEEGRQSVDAVVIAATVGGLLLLGFVPFSAKPESAWGRRRYEPGSRRHERAARRYARHTARYRRFQDSVAGAPTDA